MLRRRCAVCLFAVLASSPSEAAVRICADPISIGPIVAGSELEAKKQALDAWKAEALKLGERFAGWGTAIDRVLDCKPEPGQSVACIAAATPCTIEQAPNTLENRSKRFGI